MSHEKGCVCPLCLLAGEQACDDRGCIASKGHAGGHVPVWRAPKLLAKLLAIAVSKRIGGAS